MFWRGNNIVDIKREFLDTNGARQSTNIKVKAPEKYPFLIKDDLNVKEEWLNTLRKLNVSSQQGLVERFDSTI